MVNSVSQFSSERDILFKALSDSTRRDILERLTETNMTVSEIASSYDISLPAVSKHIHVLEKARLIKKEKIGREFRVNFRPETMRKVSEYIEFYKRFWNIQISNLEKFLSREEKINERKRS